MKTELRSRLLALRRSITEAEWRKAAVAVEEHLFVSVLPGGPCHVAAYLSLADELPTSGILARLHRGGYRVSVPAWRERAGCYSFAAWTPDEPLRTGRMRVTEPAQPRWVADADLDILLVPGLAFDVRGGRLGYGGGHYDRLLARVRADSIRVGLGAARQVVAVVPMAAHDQRVDWLVTETGAVRCPRR